MAQQPKDVKVCTFSIDRTVVLFLTECSQRLKVSKSELVERALRKYFVTGDVVKDAYNLEGFVEKAQQQLQ